MDLDVIVMKFRELQAQVAEIREKLGLAEKKEEPKTEETAAEPNPDAVNSGEEGEHEEVEEHDPETGQTQKRRRRRS